MIDFFETGSPYTIRFPCPTRRHPIELCCQPQTIVAVPRECPDCGIGLPEAYRAKLREILNITRFQIHELQQARNDIEIEIA
jgi:hypothetical protein